MTAASRQPTDTAHVNLRIREHLRAKLAAEAERNQVSLNSEMMRRLEASFEDQHRAHIAAVAQRLGLIIGQLETAWQRLEATRETAP
jgi:hypothetical protein